MQATFRQYRNKTVTKLNALDPFAQEEIAASQVSATYETAFIGARITEAASTVTESASALAVTTSIEVRR